MRKAREASPAAISSRERGNKGAGETPAPAPEAGGAPVSPVRLFWLLLCAAPPLALVGAIGIYGLAPPYRDEWDEIPLLQKALSGTATWGDWWAAHNEHRIVFSRLIMLANIHLTGWDTRWEMGLSVVLALGLYLLFVRQAGTTARALSQSAPLWLAFFLSLLIFSLGQQENWFWGIQMMMWAVALTSVGALLLLSQPPFTWGRWAAAAGLALAGMGIFGAGLVVWPLGVVALLALRKREPRFFGRALVAWTALGVATCAVYLYHLPYAANATPVSLALYEPGQFMLFFLAFLGGPLWFYSVAGAVSMGLAGLGLAAGALVWLRRVRGVDWGLLLPYVMIMLFVLANGATSAVGRLEGTPYAALATRYITVSELFWAAAVTLVALAWTAPGESGRQRPRLVRQGVIGAVVAGICLFVALDGMNGLMLAQVHFGELRDQIEKVQAGGETAHQEAFGDDHPERDAERAFMVEHQLGMFRPGDSAPSRRGIMSKKSSHKSPPAPVAAPPEREGAALGRLVWPLVALVPLLVLVLSQVTFGVNVPVWDDWAMVPMLQKAYAGTLGCADLWAPYTQHRMVVPRLIELAAARFGGWNMREEMALGLIFAVGLWLVLVRMAGRGAVDSRQSTVGSGGGKARAAALWLPALLAMLVFGLSAQEDWFTGFMLYNPLLSLTAAGLALLLTRAPLRWGRYAGAVGLAMVASYSFSIGLLCWPLGALALWWQRGADRRYLTQALPLWVGLGAANFVAYFWDYRALTSTMGTSATPPAPGEYVRFIFTYLGAPLWFVTPERACGIGVLGVVLVAGLAVLAARRRGWAAVQPYLLLALFAVGSAMLTGIGRAQGGAGMSLAPRYIVLSCTLWAAVVSLAALAWPEGALRQRKGRELALTGGLALLLVGVVWFSLNNSLFAWPLIERHYQLIAPLPEALRAGDLSKLEPAIPGQPGPLGPFTVEQMRPWLEFLREHQLSVFREGEGGNRGGA